MTFFIDRWAEIPGGPLRFSPYTEFNKSYHSEDELSDTKGFVLMSTKFNNKANISAIEFVPMNEVTNGKLIIEVCIIGFGLIKSIRNILLLKKETVFQHNNNFRSYNLPVREVALIGVQ